MGSPSDGSDEDDVDPRLQALTAEVEAVAEKSPVVEKVSTRSFGETAFITITADMEE